MDPGSGEFLDPEWGKNPDLESATLEGRYYFLKFEQIGKAVSNVHLYFKKRKNEM
jgi:hypothetical protein